MKLGDLLSTNLCLSLDEATGRLTCRRKIGPIILWQSRIDANGMVDKNGDTYASAAPKTLATGGSLPQETEGFSAGIVQAIGADASLAETDHDFAANPNGTLLGVAIFLILSFVISLVFVLLVHSPQMSTYE